MTATVSEVPTRSDLLAALTLPGRGFEPADLPQLPGAPEGWDVLTQRHRELIDELLFLSHVRRSMVRDGGDAGVLAAGRRITDAAEAHTREAWSQAVDAFLSMD